MQPSKCSRCLGGGQGRVREEFLTASSGNLRLCSFCGFFLIFFFHLWVARAGLSPLMLRIQF